jgi:peptidoglycan/xylan/chitin deacetylase (PgdA/CDA1 family)
MGPFLQKCLNTIYAHRSHTNQAIILAYHSVADNTLGFTVTPAAFAQHMDFLRSKQFNVVSLDQLAAYRKQGVIPPKTVAITFDDGFQDNYTIAFPILKAHGFPATIFLTTSSLAGERVLHGVPLKILSEDELRTLQHSGLVTIGAHTTTHPKFTKITQDAMEREVQESKNMVEQILGVPCLHFAYPHGRHSAEAYVAVARAGIIYAYTTEVGSVRSTDNSYALNRNVIDHTTSLEEFTRIVLYGRVSLTRVRRDLRASGFPI